jgi:hypothetical protein
VQRHDLTRSTLYIRTCRFPSFNLLETILIPRYQFITSTTFTSTTHLPTNASRFNPVAIHANKMKFIAAISAILAGASAVVGQVQSKPFRLEIVSSDKALDGKGISACHTGAAIESLCIVKGKGVNLYFNTTKGDTEQLPGYTKTGALVYNLPAGDMLVSSPMSFTYEPSTNVALPLFTPGYETQYIAFEKKNSLMTIFSYVDDSTNPPTANGVTPLKNWYVCQTYYSAYQYQTLTWVLGSNKPENPSCVKVDVKRVFV